MNNCNCCCDIVKLIHSPLKNGNSANAFVHLTRYVENCSRKIAPLPYPKPNPNSNLGGFAGGNLPGQSHGGGGNFPMMMAILQGAIFGSRFKKCFSNKN